MASSKISSPLAELYGLWALNPLIDVARVLAHDVAIQPHRYKAFSAELSDTLTGLRFKLGSDPAWPDAFQRSLAFKPLYKVGLATPQLREAALRYTERPSDPLRESFRRAAAASAEYLAPLETQALDLSVTQVRAIFARATALIQHRDMATPFATMGAPSRDWPLGADFSGAASLAIAEIVRGLGVIFCLGGSFKRLSRATPAATRPLVPEFTVALTADKFLMLQRAGHYGGRTLSLLLAPKADLGSDELISAAYEWTKVLQRLVPDVARAWTDIEYRCELSDLEWGMAPNPAGDLTPGAIGLGLAFSTSTVHGEICCCSGDLDCDPTSQLSDFCSEYQCTA